MDLSTNCRVPVKSCSWFQQMFCTFFFYDNFNDLCFPFDCSSPFLPLSAPYLHTSLGFIFKTYSSLLCGLPQQLHRNIYKHMNSLARPLCWFGVCPQKGNERFLAELVGTQIKTRQFTASAPAVLSLCENHAGLNPDTTGAHFVHWVPILSSFSLIPKSKGTGGDLEVHYHILSEAMRLLLK